MSRMFLYGLLFCAAASAVVSCSDDAKESPSNTAGEDASTDATPDVLLEDASLEDTIDQDTPLEDTSGPFLTGCPTSYDFAEDKGRMQDERVTEASGIIASRQNPGVLWMHNDSGDAARLYALGTDGRALGRLRLSDVDAIDMEDLALAPCPEGGGDCLWIADAGNNALNRSTVQVYAVREPPVDGESSFGSRTTSTFWTFAFTYPDEPVDSEGLVVTPDGAKVYFFEKVNGTRARLFTHTDALTIDGDHTLEVVATVDAPGIAVDHGHSITAADLHHTGSRLLIRVYTGSYEYVGDPTQPVSLETLLTTVTPNYVAAGPLSESQGESIAYDSEGVGVWTVSEGVEQAPGEMLHYYPCKPE